jgi:hypothetical protein
MKILMAFLVLALGAAAAHGFYQDLALADGTVLPNVFITRVEPDSLSYLHGQGVIRLYFHELSEDIRRQFNYDPEIAATYTYYTQQIQDEWLQRQTEAARLEAAEHQKRLDEIQEKESALKSKGAAKSTNLKLMHVRDDGSWLCRTFVLEKATGSRGRAQYVKKFDESQILVEGLPPTMADNDEWRGRIYEVGVQQLPSDRGPIRTLRQYKVLP